MVCVDAANTAKVVLGNLGVELVPTQELHALNDMEPFDGNGCSDRASSAAHGTVAAPRVLDTVRQFQFEHHLAAMACRPVPILNRGAAYDLVEVHVARWLYADSNESERSPQAAHSNASEEMSHPCWQ